MNEPEIDAVEIQPPSGFVVRRHPDKGRGLFATRAFAVGATVEVCPVVILDRDEVDRIVETLLDTYYFGWGDNGRGAIALGYGSLYNHSYEPNVRYLRDFESGHLQFVAIRPIRPGDELTVNYNGDPTCRDPVWFDIRE